MLLRWLEVKNEYFLILFTENEDKYPLLYTVSDRECKFPTAMIVLSFSKELLSTAESFHNLSELVAFMFVLCFLKKIYLYIQWKNKKFKSLRLI